MSHIDSFGLVSEIIPERPETWQGRNFLTFDVDWASDEVLTFCIDMVEQSGVSATWFITHDTPVLDRLRRNERFEVGLHPNFNNLLNSIARGQLAEENADAEKVLGRTQGLAANATSVRSHSLFQSSRLLDMFEAVSLTHDCNLYIPWKSVPSLKPWYHWNRIVRVPHCWEDDIWVIDGACSDFTGWRDVTLKVLDFHPIHIALNTQKFSDYEDSRPIHQNWNELRKVARSGFGVRSVLEQFLEKGTL
tara:strand:- start:208 stop:951 length:744 start_codon:yes stop_codon:yes gene_type:complete